MLQTKQEPAAAEAGEGRGLRFDFLMGLEAWGLERTRALHALLARGLSWNPLMALPHGHNI